MNIISAATSTHPIWVWFSSFFRGDGNDCEKVSHWELRPICAFSLIVDQPKVWTVLDSDIHYKSFLAAERLRIATSLQIKSARLRFKWNSRPTWWVDSESVPGADTGVSDFLFCLIIQTDITNGRYNLFSPVRRTCLLLNHLSLNWLSGHTSTCWPAPLGGCNVKWVVPTWHVKRLRI